MQRPGNELWHHALALDRVEFGVISPTPISDRGVGTRTADDVVFDDLFHAMYSWLAGEVGHYPLFLAVGPFDTASNMTGYHFQKPDDQTFVQVSFERSPQPITYMDFVYWNLLFSQARRRESGYVVEDVPAHFQRRLMKRSWSERRWLKQAQLEDDNEVQAVVPQLDLRAATTIWCPDESTRIALCEIGFAESRIEVVACEGD
jgi:hypothetical protein